MKRIILILSIFCLLCSCGKNEPCEMCGELIENKAYTDTFANKEVTVCENCHLYIKSCE